MRRYKTKTCQRIALHWVVRRQLNAVRALARLYFQTCSFKKESFL